VGSASNKATNTNTNLSRMIKVLPPDTAAWDYPRLRRPFGALKS